MASVCAGSLALRNAGKTGTLTAGISIGLFGNTFVTDLTADEDAASGMDLKVVGTHNGITAIQLDTKSNLQISQFFSALRLAQKHISDILGKMQTHEKCANSVPKDTAYPLSGALHNVATDKKHTAQ
jgi:polyribonucleotide nucleotidyltransferase